MIVSFETQILRESCTSLNVAESQYGSVQAQALIAIVADIEAFENAGEVIEFFSPGVSFEDTSLFLPISACLRAKLVAAGTRFDRDAKRNVVWASVKRLKLMEVEAAHE